MSNRLDADDFGPTMQRRAFKDQLKARMAALKISAAELSRRADISKDAVSSYTKMRSLPTEATLEKLARALKCKPEMLLKITDPEEDIATLVEIREYSKPGYKLLIARVPVPVNDAADLFKKLLGYAQAHATAKG
jgi:transcriptional regulator with XRE-family HTH domain